MVRIGRSHLGLAHSLLLPAPEIGHGSDHFLDFEIIVIGTAQFSGAESRKEAST